MGYKVSGRIPSMVRRVFASLTLCAPRWIVEGESFFVSVPMEQRDRFSAIKRKWNSVRFERQKRKSKGSRGRVLSSPTFIFLCKKRAIGALLQSQEIALQFRLLRICAVQSLQRLPVCLLLAECRF